MRKAPETIQHEFYTRTAARYDDMHVDPQDEHNRALQVMSALIRGYGYGSLLDVGAGTGRAVEHVLASHPGMHVRGIEPVRAMIDQAEQRHGIPAGVIALGRGDALPFADGEFDAVCELGVLHHVGDPEAIVREMTRVARRAVFLSDENRFARGGRLRRLATFGLHRLGAWPLVYRLITRGRSYRLTEGDGGVAYSYSVYDSLPTIAAWADRVFVVPTGPAGTGGMHPLFSAHHLLVCGLRDG